MGLLHLGLPCCPYPQEFLTNILYIFLISPMSTVCPSSLTLPNLINLITFFFFFFNRFCNPCGFWPAQLSLSILSRKVLQSAVASGTSNPQPGGPVIRTFQLPPPGIPHNWNDASEPQQRKVELWARNFREFCRKWRLPHHFWVLLHAVNLWHGTDGFTSPTKERALRIFLPEKSDGFGQVWTHKLGYQRPARLPLDHRSC